MNIPCVGAVVLAAEGRLLLIRRAHPPGQGLWSIPGGRVEPGESDEAALIREILEETGLHVDIGREVGVFVRELASGDRYVIRDFLATVVRDGPLTPGDDADDAAFVHPDDFEGYDLSPGMVDTLTNWGLLPVDGRPGSVAPGA